MTNTNKLREQLTDICFTNGSVNKPTVDALAEFVEQHTATAVRAAGFPYAETYDFLYNNHKDVLEELEEHLDALKKEGSNDNNL